MPLIEFEEFVRSVLLCADCAEKKGPEKTGQSFCKHIFVNQEVVSIYEHQSTVISDVDGV